MFKLPARSVIRLSVVFFIVFFTMSVVYIQAQDVPAETPTDVPTAIPTDIPTDVPTAVPTEVPTLVPTDIPTEVPTLVPTDIPTEVPTDVVTDVPTEVTEVSTTPVATAETSATPVATLAPEPALTLLVNENFDNGDITPWTPSAGWSLVPSETGFAWQVNSSNESLGLLKGNFLNAAIQARFLLQAGAAQLTLRQSVAGNYTASVDAAGVVGLYRAGALLQSAQVAPIVSGAWRTLRLSIVDGILRVAVDGIEVITLEDTAQLPPGTAGISGNFVLPTDGTVIAQNTFLVDDFALWVKSDDAAMYPTPTLIPTIVATLPPTVVPTEEVIATEEPVFSGKDLNPVPPPSAAEIIAAGISGNDNFASRFPIPSASPLPIYADSGDTTSATLEASETLPTCGSNQGFSVWFDFTPTVTATYTLSTAGSSFDTIIAIYTDKSGAVVTAPAAGSFDQVACNDDASVSTFTSLISRSLTVGKTYHIQITGFNGAFGPYNFSLMQVGVPVPAVGPALTAPIDNFNTNNINPNRLPNLTWTAVLNAHHYEIQIDDSNLFTSVNQTNPNAGLSYTVTPDLTGTTGTIYYWRVRGLNISNQPGPWSAVRKFVVDTVAPVAPNLTLPAANAIIPTSKPAFTWAAVAGAVGYLVDVTDVSCNFAPPANITNATTAITTFTPASSLAQGTYCWRVQSVDAAGNVGAESSPRSFTINIATAPLDGTFVPLGKPMFTWTAVPGATGYTLDLSTDITFAAPTVTGYPRSITAPTVSYTQATTLATGTYFWRVKSNVDADFTNAPIRTLFVGTAPAAPLLTAPLNAAFVSTAVVPLSWSTVTPPTGVTLQNYDVQLATNATFTTGVQLLTGVTSSANTPSLTAGVYYWRVRARFGDVSNPVPGVFSASRSFTVDLTPPAKPVLSLPAANAIIPTSKPVFTWAAVAGANGYYIDVDATDCTFANKVVTNQLVPTATYTIPVATPALAQGTYCWRVRAKDAAGNTGIDSDPRSFTISIATAPLDGTFVPLGKPMFTWTAVPGATGYTVELASDIGFGAPSLISGYPKSITPPAVSYTQPTTLAAGTYYWRVYSNLDVTLTNVPIRTLFVGTAPAAPVLTAPLNAALVSTAIVPLSWANVTPPANVTLQNYDVQIATNALFTPVLQTFTNVTSPNNTLALTTGVYYWRVRARFGDVSSPVPGVFSAARSFTVDITPPAAPVLSLPAANVVIPTSKPTFTWAAVVGANGYYIDVDNSGCAFPSPEVSNVLVPTATYTIPVATPALAQGTYCWRVRAKDAAGNTGLDSATRSFTIFIATAPVDGLFVPLGKPVFTWTAVPGATTYTLELATDAAFASPVSGSGYPRTINAPTVSYTQATTLPTGNYFWRVKSNLDSVAPPYRTFFVGTAPVAPVLVSPLNLASVLTAVVPLSWNAVTPPAGVTVQNYDVQIATNATFTTGVQLLTNVTSPTNTPALTAGVYYWRVRARFGDVSTPLPGVFSAARSFTVDLTAPAVPLLLLPAVNASITTNPPVLSWSPVAGAVKYNLLWGNTSTPANAVPLIAGTTYTLPSAQPLNTYYWQVQAIDAAGNTSAFSPVRSFKLISVVTAVPVLNRFGASPIVLTWGPISWVAASGHYEVVVDNSPTFLTPEFSNNNIDKTFQSISIPVAPPLVTGTYYWRVRACSGALPATCGAWSTTGIFTIDF